MEILAYVLVFLLGMLTGSGMFIAYGMWQVRKIRRASKVLAEKIKEEALKIEQKATSIKERLTEASNIAKAQLEIRAQIEMPSKNALDSKFKNGLMLELNDMEVKKLDILRTILGDGFDPTITVIKDGGHKEDVPLSMYVAEAQRIVDVALGKPTSSTSPPLPPIEDDQPKKVGKFFIYKGGRDDGTSH